MGADIYFYVEKKVDSHWAAVPLPIPTREHDDDLYDWDLHRSYDTFSVLAGVRNDNGVVPIVEPRGIPNDLSNDIKKYYDYSDAYSPSWLSLKELIDFKWDDMVVISEQKHHDEMITEERAHKDYLKAVAAVKGITYSEYASDIPPLIERLKQLGDPEDVRVVFWFD